MRRKPVGETLFCSFLLVFWLMLLLVGCAPSAFAQTVEVEEELISHEIEKKETPIKFALKRNAYEDSNLKVSYGFFRVKKIGSDFDSFKNDRPSKSSVIGISFKIAMG